MKDYNSLEVSFTVLIVSGYFLVNSGAFQRYWKIQEIQDGGSKEHDTILMSYDIISSCWTYYCPLSFIVIALIF